MNLKNRTWFTMIELMIVISIILLITFWASSIDFNTFSDKQRSESFFSKVKTTIETVKNNALIWKWIWTNLDVPSKWQINFKVDQAIITSYLDPSDTWLVFSEYSIYPENRYSIKKIVCSNIGGTGDYTLILGDTAELIITWWILKLESDCSNKQILKITTTYLWSDKIFELNTVSWVIEDQ